MRLGLGLCVLAVVVAYVVAGAVDRRGGRP